MALGACQYMTCGSMLGSRFRASFLQEDRRVDREVLLCPEHERECREVREKMNRRLGLTPEGYVFSGVWMDSLGFLVR